MKEKLLEILESKRGEYLSGEELAKRLQISRAGIWKQIQSLREDGYQILAVRNRGYCLENENNRLSLAGMLPYLKDPQRKDRITVYATVDSTNHVLKRMALDGAKDHTVVIADAQTAGRGRLGRSFYSPPGGGIYFSLLLRPTMPTDRVVAITAAASVAAARAVFAVTGRYPDIKWVNDLYLDGKKICGILTEAISNFETGTVDAIVVGIGINCHTAFPEELKEIAGNLDSGHALPNLRNHLAAELVNQTADLEQLLQDRSYLPEYRAHSMVLSKPVTIPQEPGSRYIAEQIGENGELILRSASGEERVLRSGEISLRLVENFEVDKPEQP